jgi:hypothetical protein
MIALKGICLKNQINLYSQQFLVFNLAAPVFLPAALLSGSTFV